MADVSGSVLNRATLSVGGPREEAVDTPPHPPGRPIQGVREVTSTLTALVRSARRELLIFDDPGSCLGQCVPDEFLEFAAACVAAAGDRDHDWTGTGPQSGESTPSARPGGEVPRKRRRRRSPAVGVRRIVPRHGLAGLPYPLPRQLPGRARQTESIPFKMILVDRSVAAVPLDLQLHYHGLLLIRDPVVVQALARTHETWWETGEELPSARSPVPGVLPGTLRPVLEALLAGLTDEAAATRLGMSGRTYSRRVGELMAALGTTSRFRAGAEAARRGWI
ncbi:helix-turn-helix transcriptional regulator [Streptomyces paludis]|uniref:DNA-binding response regulator n=1 Tax=Streptomyces paludis TaxID=2282738 RepID=A0A345HMH4_9ACTN|nr:DNA-binding response regulator [Streptomyces paludis]AXG77898.1 DNA-binding response regulator [Streptomyces paludis]